MGLFGFGTAKGKSGGLMNVIRCDEPEYLVWKWRPEGQGANSTSRENSIRYGSSLRVKDGEVAVFVYKQKDGALQDFIVGPYGSRGGGVVAKNRSNISETRNLCRWRYCYA